ncbi:MAG: AAA family ATPase [Deltaproteobacteria bacterium]|nr:AAA family ATPase [Deltaproteobacteria bacterium]
MIQRVIIKNFRCFRELRLDLDPSLNVIIGNNEAGKSTFLDAINLGFTGRIGRLPVLDELTSHDFHAKVVEAYLGAIRKGDGPHPPSISIELFFDETETTGDLRGTNNSLGENCPGILLMLEFDSNFEADYRELLKVNRTSLRGIPVEFYHCVWRGFDGSLMHERRARFKAPIVDASKIRLKSGSDFYLRQILDDTLNPQEKARLTRAYRGLRESFGQDQGIVDINTALTSKQKEVTNKSLTLAADIGSRSAWESGLIPHLDDLPVQYAGSGEQSCLKILLALSRHRTQSDVLLIEEPENNLAFGTLNRLISKIVEHRVDEQLIVTTHSSFVMNKLGLDKLILMNRDSCLRLTQLSPSTLAYFKRLPGYDTLRLILARKVLLVEGPSDELVVMRAYRDEHNKLPIEDGIDIISVRGLSFKRFLDIAGPLNLDVTVLTDNDGKPDGVRKRYSSYSPRFQILFSEDASTATLEACLVAANDLGTMNKALGTEFESKMDLQEFMMAAAHKTESALKIFEWDEKITMPEYIQNAVGKTK